VLAFLYALSRGQRRYGFAAAGLTMLSLAAGYAFPLLSRYVVDVVLPLRLWDKLVLICALLMLLYALKEVLDFWADYWTRLFRERTAMVLKRTMMEHLLYLPLTAWEQFSAGDLLSRLVRDTDNLKSMMLDTVLQLARSLLVTLSALAVVFALSWQLGLVLAPVAPVVFLLSVRRGRKAEQLSERMQRLAGEITTSILQPLSNVVIVKAYRVEERWIRRFVAAMSHYVEVFLRLGREVSAVSRASSFLQGAAGALLLLVGGGLIIRADITLGTLVAASYLSSYVFGGVSELAGFNLARSSARASFGRLREVWEKGREEDSGVEVHLDGRADIEFEGVHFRYPASEREVLRGASFKLREGQKLALVGPTGAGKSTIVKLLLKLYSPTAGRIRIGGLPLEDVSFRSIRQAIAYVPQEDFLFEGTIEENLRVGRWDASVQDLQRAVEAAGLAELIGRWPEGLHTPVGGRGLRLSGGERQLLSIARAFLKDAPIIVLDEATSQLDAESEAKVRAALRRLFLGRSVLIIAHRLSTVAEVDEILVLNQGVVIARGSHCQLYHSCALYRRLCQLQLIREPAQAALCSGPLSS